ncbi:MAG: DUF6900 domain-containing protein [Fimbriiglobus sp.]
MTSLDHIAQKHLNIHTLTPTRFEQLGVYTVSVRAISRALQDAYDSGSESTQVGEILNHLMDIVDRCVDPVFTPRHIDFLQERMKDFAPSTFTNWI